ncbi:hypothetical protein M9H77_09722 [Catharanthus roseus]|uniref:Uncharacterized protein n=1 Tax=Catharanthus roseus TaxID=4058 RepID=A0ACC0C1E3_CATRO|nr:hypothetical protein M9H77_09722 [Catharanthus roseus]
MEDVITEIPPPSRFLLEDLNIFTPPSRPLPLPFLLFSNPGSKEPLSPSLLIIALSSPSLDLFHHLSLKTLIGTLILPEIPFSGNSIETSLRDKSCNIYALNNADGSSQSTVVVSVQYPITPKRSLAVAKLLIGKQIVPHRVLILDSLQSRNFRGKLSRDDTLTYKLETSSERSVSGDGGNSALLKGVDYFPSGSMVDGLGAALLGRCQMRKIKGALLVSWPEFGPPAKSLVKSILLKILPDVDFSSSSVSNEDDLLLRFHDRYIDSEIYT